MKIVKKIGCFVGLAHFVLLCVLFIQHIKIEKQKPLKPIQVRTLAPQLKVPIPIATESPIPVKKSAAKKAVAAASLPKKVSKGPSTPATSSAPTPKRPPLALPSPIKSEPKVPAVSEPSSLNGPSYGEYVIAFLQSTLDLPEYGEVKIRIEIDSLGTLLDCEILDAKSSKNSAFLKKRLQELTFPCLNDFGIADAKTSFTITFKNVENP